MTYAKHFTCAKNRRRRPQKLQLQSKSRINCGLNKNFADDGEQWQECTEKYVIMTMTTLYVQIQAINVRTAHRKNGSKSKINDSRWNIKWNTDSFTWCCCCSVQLFYVCTLVVFSFKVLSFHFFFFTSPHNGFPIAKFGWYRCCCWVFFLLFPMCLFVVHGSARFTDMFFFIGYK